MADAARAWFEHQNRRSLQCRDFGHAWELAWLTKERGTGLLVRRLNCLRCGSERYDYVGRMNGHVDARYYRYAENYVFKGEGRPDKDELRRELVNDMLTDPRLFYDGELPIHRRKREV